MKNHNFPRIDGVDSDSAIARCAGNVDLYKRILLNFCQSQAHSSATFKELYTSSSFAEIQSLSHAIKGAAANLGLTAIASHAQDIEYSIRHDTVCSEELIQSLSHCLTTDIDKLETILADNSTCTAHEEHGDLSSIRSLLQQADPQVTTQLKSLVDHSTAGERQTKLREALILCQLYQFDDALEALAAL